MNYLYNAFLAEQLKYVFTFGFLKIRKSISKAAYKISNRNLELTSVSTIAASQHIYGFVPTTQSQLQV
jgi:uncharacterized membrane protein